MFNKSQKFFATKQDKVMYHLAHIGNSMVYQSAIPFNALYGLFHLIGLGGMSYLFMLYRKLQTVQLKTPNERCEMEKTNLSNPVVSPILST